MTQVSFKERVCSELIRYARTYKSIYVDYEYLICSEAFLKKSFYIISAKEDNFKHLTGVNSGLTAGMFFEKCISGTLSEADFDFLKDGQDEKAVKGTVRRKIKALPDMMDLLKEGLLAEENFKKNRIICSFAAADGSCTLGFIDTGKARPRSLIRGNELKNPKPVDLLMRRKAGSEFFDEILIGGSEQIEKYKDVIEDLVLTGLLNRHF